MPTVYASMFNTRKLLQFSFPYMCVRVCVFTFPLKAPPAQFPGTSILLPTQRPAWGTLTWIISARQWQSESILISLLSPCSSPAVAIAKHPSFSSSSSLSSSTKLPSKTVVAAANWKASVGWHSHDHEYTRI